MEQACIDALAFRGLWAVDKFRASDAAQEKRKLDQKEVYRRKKAKQKEER